MSTHIVLYSVETIKHPKANAALLAAEFMIDRELGRGLSFGWRNTFTLWGLVRITRQELILRQIKIAE